MQARIDVPKLVLFRIRHPSGRIAFAIRVVLHFSRDEMPNKSYALQCRHDASLARA